MSSIWTSLNGELEIAGKGLKWMEMDGNCWKWLEMAANGLELWEMKGNCLPTIYEIMFRPHFKMKADTKLTDVML